MTISEKKFQDMILKWIDFDPNLRESVLILVNNSDENETDYPYANQLKQLFFEWTEIDFEVSLVSDIVRKVFNSIDWTEMLFLLSEKYLS